MQDPDRLNGGSLPIDGGRPPIGGIPLNFDTLPGAPPTPMPDYMRELLDQIKGSSPKAAPAPAPAQTAPAQTAPPQQAPVPPVGSQGGFLDWAKRELNPLDAASWKEAGNISKDMLIDTSQYVQQSLADAPISIPGTFGGPSITGGDLATGVVEFLKTQEAGAMAQASEWGQNIMEFATGTSAIGEALGIPQPDSSRMAEAAERHRADMSVTKWADGEFGDPSSWQAAVGLRDDLVVQSREAGLAAEIMMGMSSFDVLLPMPIVDQALGAVFTGAGRLARAVRPKAKIKVIDTVNPDSKIEVTDEVRARYEREKQAITQFHPRAQEGIEIPVNPIQQVINDTAPGKASFFYYDNALIDGKMTPGLKLYRDIDVGSPRYLELKQAEAEGLGVMVEPGQQVQIEEVNSYVNDLEQKIIDDEATPQVADDVPITNRQDLLDEVERTAQLQDEAEANFDAVSAKGIPAPRTGTREFEELRAATRGGPNKRQRIQAARTGRASARAAHKAAIQAFKDATGETEIPTTLTPEPEAPIAEPVRVDPEDLNDPVATTTERAEPHPELAETKRHFYDAIRNKSLISILQPFRNALQRYPQNIQLRALGEDIATEWNINYNNWRIARREYAEIIEEDSLTAPAGPEYSKVRARYDDLQWAEEIEAAHITPIQLAPDKTFRELLAEFDATHDLEMTDIADSLIVQGTPTVREERIDVPIDWTGIEERIANNYQGFSNQNLIFDTRHAISTLEDQYSELIPPEISEEYEVWFNELEDLIEQSRINIDRGGRLADYLLSPDDSNLIDLQGALEDAINNVAIQIETLGYSLETVLPWRTPRYLGELRPVKRDAGEPIEVDVFHGTDAPASPGSAAGLPELDIEPAPGQPGGLHFGTEQAARDYLDDPNISARTSRVIPVRIRLEKPYGTIDDPISEDDLPKLMMDQLKEEGFDGIVYRNLAEDPGSVSYIVFDPEKSLASFFDPTSGSGLVGKSVEDISTVGLFKGTATVIQDGPVIGGERKVLIEVPGREPFYTNASSLKEVAEAAPDPGVGRAVESGEQRLIQQEEDAIIRGQQRIDEMKAEVARFFGPNPEANPDPSIRASFSNRQTEIKSAEEALQRRSDELQLLRAEAAPGPGAVDSDRTVSSYMTTTYSGIRVYTGGDMRTLRRSIDNDVKISDISIEDLNKVLAEARLMSLEDKGKDVGDSLITAFTDELARRGEAAPDPSVPDAAAGVQPDMFGRPGKAIYNTDADMSQARFNLTPEEQASGLEQVADQVDSGEKDRFDGLADASKINQGRTPNTEQEQLYLSTSTKAEVTEITINNVTKKLTRYRVAVNWKKSRANGDIEGLDAEDLREIEIPDTVAWIVEETADDAGTGPPIAYRLHGVGDDGQPGIELASFKTLKQAREGLKWDTANNWIGFWENDGTFGVWGGGGGTAFPGQPNFLGPDGQARLNNAINIDLIQIKRLKRLVTSLTDRGMTSAATRLRIRASDLADRLDNLANRIDQDFPGNNGLNIKRAVYQETSTIRPVSPEERSIFIARRDEPERMGMGLGVQEKVDFINSRLIDHRSTKEILDQTIAERGEDWEDLSELIQGDIFDEAEELRVLADNLPIEGTEAAQGVTIGIRDEVYDEIGDVDPRWRIWDVEEGGGPSDFDPIMARELEIAAENNEKVIYVPTRQTIEGVDDGAPTPPNMNKPPADDGFGYQFISIKNLRTMKEFYNEDVIVHDSAAIRYVYTYTPMRLVDDTVRKYTPPGRLMTAYMMHTVASEQWIDVTLQATFDAYAKQGKFGFGRGLMDLPIDKDTGMWGDSGLHWADVWSFWNGKHKAHIDKYSDRLNGKLKNFIAEFSNVVNDEVERLREMNGLPARKKKRGFGEVYIPRKVEGLRDPRPLDQGGTGKFIPFERPTNPNHERMWEMATEAYQKHGVEYVNDPRAVLELHLRAAVSEIRLHQMEGMIEELGFGVSISKLVNPQILAKKTEAQEAFKAAEDRLKEVSKEIFGEEIYSRMGAGISNIHIDMDLAADISKAQAALRSDPDFADNLKRLNDEYEVLAGKMVERTSADGVTRMERTGGTVGRLKKERTAAKSAYDKHVKRLKNSAYVEITGGNEGLFGESGKVGLHPITPNRYKTKFFLTEDYKEIRDFIDRMDPNIGSGPGQIAITGFQTLANTIRWLASGFDFALPFINLLPVLGDSPRAWTQGVANHYKAFADPTVQARLVRDNVDDYYDLAVNGVPVGDPEYFAALAPGQGINIEAVMKKWRDGRPAKGSAEKAIYKMAKEGQQITKGFGKQTAGRFQTAYQTGLGHARVMLLKALRDTDPRYYGTPREVPLSGALGKPIEIPHIGAKVGAAEWKGTDNELYSYIRNMTGGLDSRRSGIGPGQRAFEGMFLAFSPRLLRATIALVSDAIQVMPRYGAQALGKGAGPTAQQRRSLKAISQLIAGTYGIYYVTAKWGFGMDDKDILEGMNPGSGRKFLSVQINGDWVGVGGQIRALMQFSWAMMGVMSQGQVGEDDRKWSDLLSLNTSKNPFVYLYMSRGAPGTQIIGAAGESFMGADILPFDNPDGPLDFATHLGGSSIPFSLQHYLESKTWESAAMEFFGARASFNPRDRATAYITSGEESTYSDQPKMVKWLVNELIETEQSEFDSVETRRRKELLALFGTDFNYLTWIGIENKATGGRGQAAEGEDFGPPADVKDPDPNARALAQYYSIFRDPRVKDAEGISMPNGNLMFSRILNFKASMPESSGGFGWTIEQKQFVIANTNIRPVPWFVLRKVGGVRAESIKRSQKMREQIFIDQGRKDLAQISHRLFYMLPPGEGAHSDVLDQMVEGSPPDFGPSGMEGLWEWQQERTPAGAGAR